MRKLFWKCIQIPEGGPNDQNALHSEAEWSTGVLLDSLQQEATFPA